jgi:uncharacterized membrane protein
VTEEPLITRRPRRWPLYASLFLNVVLITAIAAGAWRVAQWRDGPRMAGPWMPRQIEQILPDASREKVREIRKARQGEMRPLFATARQARDVLRTTIDAEPFDPAAMRAALAGVREADSAIATAAGDMMVEIATVLTPEERRLVRDKVRELGPRHKGNQKRDDKKDKDGGGDDVEGPPLDGDMPPPPPPPL